MSETYTRPSLPRRFNQISRRGFTEQGTIVIPIPPEDAPNNSFATPQRTNPQNRGYQRQLRAQAKQREEALPELEIEEVQFNLFSPQEVDYYTVVNVTSTESDGPNSVRDLRMGPHNDSEVCETCSKNILGCTGHPGKIILPKLMHPLLVKHIIAVLSCICNSCGRLLVKRSELEDANITRLSGLRRLQAIRDLVGMLKRHCQRGDQDPQVERCVPNPIYASLREHKDKYFLAYAYPGQNKDKLFFRMPEEIYNILDSIPPEDAELLGFIYGSHPRTLIIDRFIVIPYCARHDVFQGDKFFPDDLTTMYIDIVGKAREYNAPGISEAEQDAVLQDLYFKVSHFMKNDGRYKQGSVKVYTDVNTRIQGKSAIIRQNIMGKRVNFTGRTVAGPGAFLRVDEVGIPRLMAKILTRPFIVMEMNRAELQAKYDQGKVTHITPISGPSAGSRVMVSAYYLQQNPDRRLQLGDEVERMLENGDIVLVNRQPSLHKQSMLALRVKLIDDRIIRINLSITTPLNADFDGDELNIHVPQTIEAYAEAEQLLSIQQNLMSAQTNKPMMGIVYDSLLGAYLLTRTEQIYDDLGEAIEKLRRKLEGADPDTEEYQRLSESMAQKIARREEVGQKRILDPIVVEQSLIHVANAPQMLTLRLRLNKYGVPWGSGRALFSAALPEDFDYNAKGVLIKEGVLLKGTLSKDTLGPVSGSIIAEMYKQLGGVITVSFMSDVQFILNEFLAQRGFTVALEDCIPDDPDFRQNIEAEVATAVTKLIELTRTTTNRIVEEQQERKILEFVEKIRTESGRMVQERLHTENALLIMANAGAKGTSFNTAQISATLGQQLVGGRRIPANLSGNRALPVFEPNTRDPRARGFCYNSFSTGLEPSEFFFHAQGGREGLTDTAVNTAKTGALQHQLIKSAEDIHISPDGSVRTSDNSIVQFVYGDDGFDSSELGTIKIQGESVPFFRNIYQLADRINRRYQPANIPIQPLPPQPILEEPELTVMSPVQHEEIQTITVEQFPPETQEVPSEGQFVTLPI